MPNEEEMPNDLTQHTRDSKLASQKLLDAQWQADPKRMWQLAHAGVAVLPTHLQGLKLQAPIPASERIFRLDDPNRVKDSRPWVIDYQAPGWFNRLIQTVADIYSFDVTEILGRSRKPMFVEARAVIAIVLRAKGLSYPRIGYHLRRDHSTVINLCEGNYRERATEIAEAILNKMV